MTTTNRDTISSCPSCGKIYNPSIEYHVSYRGYNDTEISLLQDIKKLLIEIKDLLLKDG
jgi:hypothetical protein